MATREELQARLDRLRQQRASPERQVRDSSGREVSYKSDAELAAAIASVEAQLAAIDGRGPVHTVRIYGAKGFGD